MRDSAKLALGTVGFILAIAVLYVVVTLIFGGTSLMLAPFRGEVQQQNQTQGNGQYRIAKYDSFHDQCNAISALQKKIVITSQAPDANQPNTIDGTNLNAQKQQLEDMVGSYNSDASKTDTAGAFRSSNLPYHLDSQESVTCD